MARIWIVEDDPQIGLLIEMTVKKAGHEARRMVDGVELERAVQKDAPELLLLDVMPVSYTHLGGNAGMTAGWGYVICATVAAGILFHSDLSRGLARLRRRGA